jgi:hypothetical protein
MLQILSFPKLYKWIKKVGTKKKCFQVSVSSTLKKWFQKINCVHIGSVMYNNQKIFSRSIKKKELHFAFHYILKRLWSFGILGHHCFKKFHFGVCHMTTYKLYFKKNIGIFLEFGPRWVQCVSIVSPWTKIGSNCTNTFVWFT